MKKITIGQVIDGFIDWAVFIGASGICMLRTAEIFSHFSPDKILGFSGVSTLYGIMSALLVEGLLIVVKISLTSTKTAWNWLFNILLIALLWGVSAAAQVGDYLLSASLLAQQPPEIQGLVTYGIPLVPSVILLAVMARGVIRTIPADLLGSPENQPVSAVTVPVVQSGVNGGEKRRNDLTPEDKDFCAKNNTRAILARFGGSASRSRDWRKLAKEGKL